MSDWQDEYTSLAPVETDEIKSVQRKVLFIAVLKGLVGLLFGIIIAILIAPFVIPYLFCRYSYLEHEWPWNVEGPKG